jgi:hypothetical protein
MATTQVTSATINFDGAGNPTTVTLAVQLNVTGGSAPIGSLTYALDAADKAALVTMWGKAKAALTLP